MTCENAAGRRSKYFRHQVPLPPDLTTVDIFRAIEGTEQLVKRFSRVCEEMGLKPLPQIVQANNLGGIISNLITHIFGTVTPYVPQSDRAGPDLRHREKPVSLEVKSANHPAKGGEGHNGHGGWHVVACYQTEKSSGEIRFVHVMLADLIGWEYGEKDWKFVKSTQVEGGTGHIETYATTPQGRSKLLDGTVYLDTESVPNWRRWRRTAENLPIPRYSIFHQPSLNDYQKRPQLKRHRRKP